MWRAAFLAGTACLAACTTTAEPPAVSEPEPPASCPVSGSRNWHAWIDRMPGPDAGLTLNISGEVDLPLPGYEVSLRAGPADRMMPPSQRFALDLKAPTGMVAQVVTPSQVTYRAPTRYSAMRSVITLCEGEEVISIPDVAITD